MRERAWRSTAQRRRRRHGGARRRLRTSGLARSRRSPGPNAHPNPNPNPNSNPNPSPPPSPHPHPRPNQVGERRARLRFGPGIEGTVAPADMSEKALQKPHRTLKRGEERTCVVLACDPSQKKLLLSLKPSLVESTLPRVATFAEAKVS